MAEFWGIFEGLKLIKFLGLIKVELNMDSLLVVKVIEEDKTSRVDCLALIREILRLIEDHEIVQVVHAFRETNMCANVLETQGTR